MYSSSLMLQIGGFAGDVARSSSGSMRAETLPVAGRRKKRARSVAESWCQVEGCGANLSGGKLYHVRHRACVDHSKSPAVGNGSVNNVAGGLFTTGLAIDRPFSHFSTSKPTRTDVMIPSVGLSLPHLD